MAELSTSKLVQRVDPTDLRNEPSPNDAYTPTLALIGRSPSDQRPTVVLNIPTDHTPPAPRPRHSATNPTASHFAAPDTAINPYGTDECTGARGTAEERS